MPDADDQEFGVVALHGLQQLLGRVDTDRLGELEFHTAVGEVILDVVHLTGLRESRVDIGVARSRVDDPQGAATQLRLGDAVFQRRAAERVRAVSDHYHDCAAFSCWSRSSSTIRSVSSLRCISLSTRGISSSAAISTYTMMATGSVNGPLQLPSASCRDCRS